MKSPSSRIDQIQVFLWGRRAKNKQRTISPFHQESNNHCRHLQCRTFANALPAFTVGIIGRERGVGGKERKRREGEGWKRKED